MIRQRLYLQIYLTILAALALTVIATSFAFSRLGPETRPSSTAIALAHRAVAEALPSADAPFNQQQAVLARIGSDLSIELALFAANGDLIAAYPQEAGDAFEQLENGIGDDPEHMLRLHDGRTIFARVPFPGIGGVATLFIVLGSVAAAIGAASYPFVRRLTGRVERLQAAVERIGQGELDTRAQLEGRDEIAALAESFNRAADRIEALVEAHRVLLANASHELRTPLSRIRLGIEMFEETGDRSRLSGVTADIAQLDQLIDEILTLSRLDAGAVEMEAEIDLLGLVAEECAGFGVAVEGEPTLVTGNRDLLARLVRNLVANAQTHGAPPVEVEVRSFDGRARLTVRDGGPGIVPEEREKVFNRFYRGRGKQKGNGYGLGLPLVRQIAAAHGGSVAVTEKESSEIVVVFSKDA